MKSKPKSKSKFKSKPQNWTKSIVEAYDIAESDDVEKSGRCSRIVRDAWNQRAAMTLRSPPWKITKSMDPSYPIKRQRLIPFD